MPSSPLDREGPRANPVALGAGWRLPAWFARCPRSCAKADGHKPLADRRRELARGPRVLNEGRAGLAYAGAARGQSLGDQAPASEAEGLTCRAASAVRVSLRFAPRDHRAVPAQHVDTVPDFRPKVSQNGPGRADQPALQETVQCRAGLHTRQTHK